MLDRLYGATQSCDFLCRIGATFIILGQQIEVLPFERRSVDLGDIGGVCPRERHRLVIAALVEQQTHIVYYRETRQHRSLALAVAGCVTAHALRAYTLISLVLRPTSIAVAIEISRLTALDGE